MQYESVISRTNYIKMLKWVDSIKPTKDSISKTVAKMESLAGITPAMKIAISNSFRSMTALMKRDPVLGLTPMGAHLVKETLNVDELEVLKISDSVREWDIVLLTKVFIIGRDHYMHDHGVLIDYDVEEQHYECVDFWRNWAKMGPEVTPNTYKRRLGQLSLYLKPKIFKPDFKALDQAANLVARNLGYQFNSSEMTKDFMGEIAFSKKHSGVGCPFYMNSKTILEGISVNDRAFDLAQKLDIEDMLSIPALLGPRDQRGGYEVDWDKVKQIKPLSGEDVLRENIRAAVAREFKPSKPRVIYMYSRTENFLVSPVLVPMIHMLQDVRGYFVTYSTPKNLKDWLKVHHSICKLLGYESENIDFPSFDASLSADLMIYGGMVGASVIKDARGKKIWWHAIAAAITKPLQVPVGQDIKMVSKFGALPSGMGFTGALGGFINLILICYAKIKTYGYTETVRIMKFFFSRNRSDTAVIGDDDQTWAKKHSDINVFSSHLKAAFGIELHSSKGERGTFLTQYRLVGDELRSPSPRMITKSFYTESPKHLFAAEWVMSTWAKLDRLWNNTDFEDSVRLIGEFTKDKIGTYDFADGSINTPKKFINTLREETESHGNSSTSEAISDGDPLKDYVYNSKGDVSDDFVTRLMSRIQKVFINQA